MTKAETVALAFDAKIDQYDPSSALYFETRARLYQITTDLAAGNFEAHSIAELSALQERFDHLSQVYQTNLQHARLEFLNNHYQKTELEQKLEQQGAVNEAQRQHTLRLSAAITTNKALKQEITKKELAIKEFALSPCVLSESQVQELFADVGFLTKEDVLKSGKKVTTISAQADEVLSTQADDTTNTIKDDTCSPPTEEGDEVVAMEVDPETVLFEFTKVKLDIPSSEAKASNKWISQEIKEMQVNTKELQEKWQSMIDRFERTAAVWDE